MTAMRMTMAAALAACLLAPALWAEDNVIVIDGHQPARRQAQKPDHRTKVISLKGNASKGADTHPADDVCQKLGGLFYCRNRGRGALETSTGTPLGKITGVAWRDRGQSIGAYLRRIEDAGDQGTAIGRNIPAMREGFFYIIQDASGRIFMAEVERIAPEG